MKFSTQKVYTENIKSKITVRHKLNYLREVHSHILGLSEKDGSTDATLAVRNASITHNAICKLNISMSCEQKTFNL